MTNPEPGQRLVALSLSGTVAFTVLSVAAVVVDGLEPLALAFDGVLFAIGCAIFLLAIVTATRRSREAEMGIGGLFFLAGSAPRRVRWLLLGSLAAQVVVALTTASLRLFTPLAGGILVPMYGLALTGLWGARYGSFPARRRPSPMP